MQIKWINLILAGIVPTVAAEQSVKLGLNSENTLSYSLVLHSIETQIGLDGWYLNQKDGSDDSTDGIGYLSGKGTIKLGYRMEGAELFATPFLGNSFEITAQGIGANPERSSKTYAFQTFIGVECGYKIERFEIGGSLTFLGYKYEINRSKVWAGVDANPELIRYDSRSIGVLFSSGLFIGYLF
jgi:hypothetical protein